MRILFTFLVCILFSSAYAYNAEDLQNANFLASKGLIVNHSNSPDKYRLDSKVSRQEIVGLALKLKGVQLPEEYDCKNYFSDAQFSKTHSENWVCRAFEIGANQGFVSRQNIKARPRDSITFSEAMSILLKSKNIKTLDSKDGYGTNGQKWQRDIGYTALARNIYFPQIEGDFGPGGPFDVNALPNRGIIFKIMGQIIDASTEVVYTNQDFGLSLKYRKNLLFDVSHEDIYDIFDFNDITNLHSGISLVFCMPPMGCQAPLLSIEGYIEERSLEQLIEEQDTSIQGGLPYSQWQKTTYKGMSAIARIDEYGKSIIFKKGNMIFMIYATFGIEEIQWLYDSISFE